MIDNELILEIFSFFSHNLFLLWICFYLKVYIYALLLSSAFGLNYVVPVSKLIGFKDTFHFLFGVLKTKHFFYVAEVQWNRGFSAVVMLPTMVHLVQLCVTLQTVQKWQTDHVLFSIVISVLWQNGVLICFNCRLGIYS